MHEMNFDCSKKERNDSRTFYELNSFENSPSDLDKRELQQERKELSSNRLLRLTTEVIHFVSPSAFCLQLHQVNHFPNVSTNTSFIRKHVKKTNNEIQYKNFPIEKSHSLASSSRTVPYDASMKVMRSMNNSAAHAASFLAAMQKGGRNGDVKCSPRKASDHNKSFRAARANQRRMLKDSWIRGGVKETMKGCEHALRFGKSLIHGWGVFSDEDITAGDLIVEYRGVLIGNAVADRREQEYERAKIGSDYMFRIDPETVCDATHQGCVARFINASCTPNCYTQIITVNGVKRIAIYAKKDIRKGEELCYDYKFELEHDETKRIPCNCGSTQCRGFMNWDQRYVSLTPPLKHGR